MLERWRTENLLLAPGALWDGQSSHASFDAWCARHRGRRCRLWLAAPLLVELVAAPGLPLSDDDAVLAWAGSQLQHYHGSHAAAWALAAWQQGGARGVSALHGASLPALLDAAHAAGVRLVAASPWWALALQQALAADATLRRGESRLLVVEGTRVVVVDLAAGGVQALALRHLDIPEPGELAELMASLPSRPTRATGYGLSAGELQAVQPLAPLDQPWPEMAALTPPLAWQ